MKSTLQALMLRLFIVLPTAVLNLFLTIGILFTIHQKNQAQTTTVQLSSAANIGGYHLKCFGQSNASVSANINFGTPPYTFLWNTGDTTATLKNKPAGIYIVTVTDANLVSESDTFELKQPQPLSFQSNVKEFFGFNISKYGGNTGNIQLAGEGGTPPYNCLWSTGESVFYRQDLVAGNYSFTITDANQCSTTGSITLTEPNPIQINFTNVQNTLCSKSNDGSVLLNISGGLGNYSVVWDNGSFDMNPTDLKEGYNEVRIYEQGKAIIDTGIIIGSPTPIMANVTLSNYGNGYNVSCIDCFNGSINTSVSGGTAPYTYQWNDENNSTTANLSNLNGGEYALIITDAQGCIVDEIIKLNMPIPADWSRFGNNNIDTSQFIGSTDTSAMVFKTNNQEALRLMGNGNVGIKNSNPMQALDIIGNLKTSGLMIFDNESYIAPMHGTDSTLSGIYIGEGGGPYTPIPKPTCITVNNSLLLNGSFVSCAQGFLGKPTTYFGNDGANGIIESTSESATLASFTALLLNYYCGNNIIAGNSQSGALIANYRLGVGTGSPSERLHVEGKTWLNGNVHIGDNANPVSLLAVEGKVFAREFHVNEANNWPDYVFDKNYVLLPIPALKAYLTKNKHLPGMPTAQTVENEGYDLGATLKILTKQVEELHLYIIQLKAEIDSLKK